jgi:hypothetical protein
MRPRRRSGRVSITPHLAQLRTLASADLASGPPTQPRRSWGVWLLLYVVGPVVDAAAFVAATYRMFAQEPSVQTKGRSPPVNPLE